ncbi:MAG: ATP-binding protein [Chitinophagales bacterium]
MEEIAKLKIDSRLENISKVENLMDSLRIQFSINDEQYGNMLLASVEAVTNAIEHGNNLDAKKHVEIAAYRSDCALRVSIKDEGNGFSPDKLPDPTAPEFREQPDGRGVFLMKKLADEVNFRDNGSCVIMKFFLS